jgi:hypothetical protein
MRAAHPKLLGDATQDLTFTPITPCRIVDTRNALGPIAAFTARNYYDWSNTSTFDWGVFQGGVAGASGTVCPQTLLGPGGQPAAVLMTVTVVNQAGPGTIVVWGGTSPVASASTLSYPATGFFANNTVVQVGGRVGTGPGGGVLDFGVYINAFTSAGVAVDVVGYFFPPQASALDCTTVTANGTAAANTDTGLAFPAAPSGYTKTGGYCYGAAFSPTGALLETGPNSCYFRNSSLATYAIHAIGTYCRTPGR